MRYSSCESEVKSLCRNKTTDTEQERQLVEHIRKTIGLIKLNLDSLEGVAKLEQANRMRQFRILDNNLAIILERVSWALQDVPH